MTIIRQRGNTVTRVIVVLALFLLGFVAYFVIAHKGQGHLTNDDTEIVTQNGITMTISPTHGPAGTKVKVALVGIVPNPNAPYASISLLASNGLGKDITTKISQGMYETTYVIPTTVMTSQPGDQNYTTEAPIAIGNGDITFSYQHPTLHDISIKAAFAVTSH